jgi:hypothetical protein
LLQVMKTMLVVRAGMSRIGPIRVVAIVATQTYQNAGGSCNTSWARP